MEGEGGGGGGGGKGNGAAPFSCLALSARGPFDPSLQPPLPLSVPLEEEFPLYPSPPEAAEGGGGGRRRLALPPALAAAADGWPPPPPPQQQQQLAPFPRRECVYEQQDNEFGLSPLLRLSP